MNRFDLIECWRSFRAEHGCTVERMVCSPGLRMEFLERAFRDLGPHEEEAILSALLRLRKQGRVGRETAPPPDQAGPAEIRLTPDGCRTVRGRPPGPQGPDRRPLPTGSSSGERGAPSPLAADPPSNVSRPGPSSSAAGSPPSLPPPPVSTLTPVPAPLAPAVRGPDGRFLKRAASGSVVTRDAVGGPPSAHGLEAVSGTAAPGLSNGPRSSLPAGRPRGPDGRYRPLESPPPAVVPPVVTAAPPVFRYVPPPHAIIGPILYDRTPPPPDAPPRKPRRPPRRRPRPPSFNTQMIDRALAVLIDLRNAT